LCLAGGDGGLRAASTYLTDALEKYRGLDETSWQLDAHISLGWSCALRSDDRALECLRQALAITESAGETMLRSWALWAMGFLMWRRGEIDQATHELQTGIRSAQLVTDPLIAAVCTEALGWTAAEQHRYRRAAVLMGAADALGRVAGVSAFMLHDLLVYRKQAERAGRAALGTRVFEAARQEGAGMNFDTAILFALGEKSAAAAPAEQPAGELTRRERQVADLVAEGLTNKAIAARLVISQRTAEGHVEHILTKLGFSSRAQIAAWASEQPRE
jgi:non-specific serine/threonine protein kinase